MFINPNVENFYWQTIDSKPPVYSIYADVNGERVKLDANQEGEKLTFDLSKLPEYHKVELCKLFGVEYKKDGGIRDR